MIGPKGPPIVSTVSFRSSETLPYYSTRNSNESIRLNIQQAVELGKSASKYLLPQYYSSGLISEEETHIEEEMQIHRVLRLLEFRNCFSISNCRKSAL